jgi:hypothetical protein
MKSLLRLLLILMPWPLRRCLLILFCGYELHPTSHIGLAWIYPGHLVMGAGARIGHLTFARGMDLISLGKKASIGRLNWISGYPTGRPPHFLHLPDRAPRLVLDPHAAITHRHLIDCTDCVRLGRFATLAGFRSQILTHSIDLKACRQHARPVSVGAYCFVGTSCTLHGGAVLPDYSVLAAHSLLNKAFVQGHRLYGGVPAREITKLDPAMGYFQRTQGFVT